MQAEWKFTRSGSFKFRHGWMRCYCLTFQSALIWMRFILLSILIVLFNSALPCAYPVWLKSYSVSLAKRIRWIALVRNELIGNALQLSDLHFLCVSISTSSVQFQFLHPIDLIFLQSTLRLPRNRNRLQMKGSVQESHKLEAVSSTIFKSLQKLTITLTILCENWQFFFEKAMKTKYESLFAKLTFKVVIFEVRFLGIGEIQSWLLPLNPPNCLWLFSDKSQSITGVLA